MTPYDTEILAAIFVFLGIYLVFFLIRLFADMMLVGIALSCAVAAFSITSFYPQYREMLQDLKFLSLLGIQIPEEPTTWGVFIISCFIIILGVILSLPFLPFSQTYRQMLGVEKLSLVEEERVRTWVSEEIDNLLEDDEERVKGWVNEEIDSFSEEEEERVKRWIVEELERLQQEEEEIEDSPKTP